MPNHSHRYALIMAGGTGTRLYPRSREDRPKQFQKIIGKKTLLRQTFERVRKVVPASNIVVSTNEKYRDLVVQELPEVNPFHVIGEPAKRNTAPAMALATALVAASDPKALIATVASDHLVLKPNEFANALKAAFSAIKQHPDHMATIGITPSSPHTGYGYIERGKHMAAQDGFDVYHVKRFVEKPDKKTAQKYVVSGRFFWNAAYFVWQADHFLSETKRYLPSVYNGVMKIQQAGKQFEKVLKREFNKFPETPIDTAIMEKTEHLLVIPADLGWSDVGSWDSVVELIDATLRSAEGNYAEGLHVGVDTKNTVVLSDNPDRLIATIGVENLTVVATDDAVLITTQGRSEEVKKVIEALKQSKKHHLL